MTQVAVSAVFETVLGGDYQSLILARTGINHYYRLNNTSGIQNIDEVNPDNVFPTLPDYSAAASGGVTFDVDVGNPDGQPGASFDGVNGYMNVADSTVPLTAGPLSIGAWITKLGTPGSDAGIAGTDYTNGYQINWHNGTAVYFYIGDGAHSANFSFSASGRHRFVGTWDGTTNANGIKLYIDGVLVAQGSAATTVLTAGTNRFRIGRSTSYFPGYISDVDQYTVALTPAQVLEDYLCGSGFTDITADALDEVHIAYGINGNDPLAIVAGTGTAQLGLRNDYRSAGYAAAVLADGPVGYWRMDAASGLVEIDRTLHGYNGTIAGGPTLNAAGALSDGDKATTFAFASSQYVTMGTVSALNFTSAFSIEAWVKFTDITKHLPIVTNGGSGGYFLFTYLGEGTIRFGGLTSGGSTLWDIRTTPAYNDGAYHHVVCTWDGTTGANKVIIYVDGQSVKTGTAAGTNLGGFNPFEVAAYAGTYFMEGSIDEVAAYSYALTSTQVANHYALRLVALDVRKPLGYYSPGNANVRTGWTYGCMFRVRFLYSAAYYTRHRGRVRTILPDTGAYGRRQVAVTSYDVMRDLAEADVREIALQINKSESEVVQAVIDTLPVSARPVATDIDAGVDTFPFALDNIGLSTKALSIIADAAYSSQALIACKGDGTFILRTRHSRADAASIFTFSGDFLDLEVPSSLDGVFNFVRVTNHAKTVDATATTVLYALTGTPPAIGPNDRITITGAFNDPANAQRLIGGEDVVIPPVAYPTASYDYAANTAIDGTGTDVTASVAVNAVAHASTVDLEVINSYGATVYLVAPSTTTAMLRVRGKGVYDRGPRTFISKSVQPYGERPPLDIDMPWQNDDNIAQSTADYIQLAWNAVLRQLNKLPFIANSSAAKMTLALTVEPGDVITVTEVVSGVTAVLATVQSVQLDYVERILTCTLGLAPGNFFTFWKWGIVGRSEWGQTTVYGY